MTHSEAPRRVVVVVGGGYTAATFSVQLVRNSPVPLDIVIVEPREHLGHGLAYSAADPDHRLNGSMDSHNVDPDSPGELRQWCEERRVFERDPASIARGGLVFLRRSEFGAFVSEYVARHAVDARTASMIRHFRATATSASHVAGGWRVETTAGPLSGTMLVVATGNASPGLRPPFGRIHESHPGIIANPLVPGCLDAIPPDARVLVVGSGLTALDVLSTLVRRRHRGDLLAISRRGLRPRAQLLDAGDPASATRPPIDVNGPVPDFLQREPARIRQWTRALRAEIRRVEAAGGSWHGPFDAVRNVAWKIWPELPVREQMRFIRRLGVFYDVHRFRAPPMNEALVRSAEQAGSVRFEAARLVGIDTSKASPAITAAMVKVAGEAPVHREFDFIVNCSGLDQTTASQRNAFLKSMLEQGVLRPHATGLGFDVTRSCEAIDCNGNAQAHLRVIGPPTLGAFGDPTGSYFIAAQVKRILPDVSQVLSESSPPGARVGGRAAILPEGKPDEGGAEPLKF